MSSPFFSRKGVWKFIIGLVICAIGIAITLCSGGQVIAWGAIVFGGFRAVLGLAQMFSEE